tara:strand:+ start:4208 stop:4459 length:252 start_codon:yes stop_codon:yes gene_type:complete
MQPTNQKKIKKPEPLSTTQYTECLSFNNYKKRCDQKLASKDAPTRDDFGTLNHFYNRQSKKEPESYQKSEEVNVTKKTRISRK